MKYDHLPVLAKEAIDGLRIKPEGKYVDATFGRGGHSLQILKKLGSDGRLIAFDKDPQAIEVAKSEPFFQDPRFRIIHASFAHLFDEINKLDLVGQIDGILLDLGVSSPQLDDPERGFSFLREGPLDMRMNPEQGKTAAEWLSKASAEEIAKVLWEYGDERFSRRIANAIVNARQTIPFTTTTQLAACIANAVPKKERHKHPATRSFQAIRIYINQELEELKTCLQQSLDVLKLGGLLCVISFHSLEDRVVKRFIRKEVIGDPLPPGLPIRDSQIKRRLRKIGGLIRPSETEINNNMRARSSRLRIAEKIA